MDALRIAIARLFDDVGAGDRRSSSASSRGSKPSSIA
jgi:hypothetical protein